MNTERCSSHDIGNKRAAPHFKDLGASGDEPIFVYVDAAPKEPLEHLREHVLALKPALVIIDTLFRFIRCKDGNNYNEVTIALEPLLMLARQTGTHIMTLHHTRKGLITDEDSVLGSTAIFGTVDTLILIASKGKHRTVHSRQRYGVDIEESVLVFDAEHRRITLGERQTDNYNRTLEHNILKFVQGETEPVTETQIVREVIGRTQTIKVAIRRLVENKALARKKDGRQYLYSLPAAQSGSVVPDNSWEPGTGNVGAAANG